MLNWKCAHAQLEAIVTGLIKIVHTQKIQLSLYAIFETPMSKPPAQMIILNTTRFLILFLKMSPMNSLMDFIPLPLE